METALLLGAAIATAFVVGFGLGMVIGWHDGKLVGRALERQRRDRE